MDQIRRQVSRARRSLVMEQFLRAATWTLFIALAVALVAVALPKLWVIPVDAEIWLWSWFGGAVGVGLLAAAVWTWFVRRTALDAAIELDRRFGLKERVSSALALTGPELETESGRALLDDAARRVGDVEVGEKFRVAARWWNILPMVPAALVFVLALLVPDAVRFPNPASAADEQAVVKKNIKKNAEELKKKLAERRKEAEEKGLKDAGDLFRQLEQGLEDLAKNDDLSRQKALTDLNKAAEQLRQRREALGGADEMKKQFNQLKDIQNGPADDLAKAVRDGEFDKAIKELDNLRQKLEDGKLTDAEKQQLAQQLNQMQEKLNQMADAHQAAKDQLKQEIDKKLQAGDREGAAQLQQQLDRLEQQNERMERMKNMANKLGKGAKSLEKGNLKDAANELNELAEELEQLQAESDELEALDDALDQLAQAKDAMACKECQGGGCKACNGQGAGKKDGPPGDGLGEGRGQGERPEEKTDNFGFTDSRVPGKLNKGKAVVAGQVRGPNVAGETREEIKDAFGAAKSDSSDPLTGQRLPKSQREHAKEYFDRFRGDTPPAPAATPQPADGLAPVP